jgi:hypothetical protein
VLYISSDGPRECGGSERAVACPGVALDAQQCGDRVLRQLGDDRAEVGAGKDLAPVALRVIGRQDAPRAFPDAVSRIFLVLQPAQIGRRSELLAMAVGNPLLEEHGLEPLCVRPCVVAPSYAPPLAHVDHQSDVRGVKRLEEALEGRFVDADGCDTAHLEDDRRKVPTKIAVLAVVALFASGCGTTPTVPRTESASREWVANARGVVDQLRGDIVSVSGFDDPVAARRALRDDSQLYGLLVAYTDFGGCRHMAAAVGVVPPGRARTIRLLHQACACLQRADELFTRAVARKAPLLLVDATRQAVAAVPALDAATLELARPD